MKRIVSVIKCGRASRLALVVGLVLGTAWMGTPLLADEAIRTQTLNLEAGWNAVYLEVYPLTSGAEAVFGGTPVDLAAYHTPGAQAQFTSDPNAASLQKAGWGIWRTAERPDAFLNTLSQLQGQQAYLLHAREAFTWNVTGSVAPVTIEWRPDAFNFLGCGVDGAAPPTFAQYFGASPAHRHNRIYRLVDGGWKRLTDPAQAAMRAGEAFWIYCDGASRYQGPLKIEIPTRQGLVLGEESGDIVLRNETEFPITPTVRHVATGSRPVPLSLVIQAVGDASAPVRFVGQPQPDGAWTLDLPPLDGGYITRVPLEARRQDMTESTQRSLIKITTDWGTVTWLPVVGLRPDLEKN